MINAGDGERIAQLGYVPQYKIAAKLIYEALQDGTLEWVKMADPEAGQLDDIQIATHGQLHAYQVKWAEFRVEFSFADFVRQGASKSGETKHSLFEQLAYGWQSFTNRYPDRAVSVYLIHKHFPSSSTRAKPPLDDNKPRYPHFQGFLKDCWYDKSWIEQGLGNVPTGWEAAFGKLKTLSGLDDSAFCSFFRNCNLQLNYQLDDINQPNSILDNIQDDIGQLVNVLTDMVGGEKRVVKLTKDELLEKLGWVDDFEHKFIHDFPVVEVYQPVVETLKVLDDKLSEIEQGYLALIGSPGSGKSTTLTHHLKYKQGFRLVKYYAYVPDSPYQDRGEANSFLHDITISLSGFGFGKRGGKQAKTREEYLARLAQQLADANKNWHETKTVTLIMVDGLDHIQRELHPQRSLLADLPPPECIPKGVIFILGSQTIELEYLSIAIKQSINPKNSVQLPSRIINMAPLQRKEVYAVIDSYPCAIDFSSATKTAICDKSAGHPLYLNYVLQQFSVSDNLKYDDLINTMPDYCGHIAKNYELYWLQIENNDELVELLGLLARIRTPIDTKEIQSWVARGTITALVTKSKHYFKIENARTWHFFHNSFRQFIIEQTSIDPFGNLDDSRDIEFHNRLASYCSACKDNTFWKWEQIYHYYMAGNYQGVLDVGQQTYFREQYFNLRHFASIVDDITLTLQSAKHQYEPLAVIRCLLVETELRARDQAHSQIDMLELFYLAQGIESAMDFMVSGSRLKIGQSKALSFISKLLLDGHVVAAKKLFCLAEPLELLSGAKAVKDNNDLSLLKGWVEVAHHFMSVTEVLRVIEQTKAQADDSQKREGFSDEDYTEYVQITLLNTLTFTVINSRDEVKINYLYQQLQDLQEDEVLCYFCTLVCHQLIKPLVNEALLFLIKSHNESCFETDDRLLLAEFVYRINGDKDFAYQLVQNIEQPALRSLSGFNNAGMLEYITRIRLNRLLTAIGYEVNSEDAIPYSTDPMDNGIILFERLVMNVANANGRVWENDNLAPLTVLEAIRPALNLFALRYDTTSDWSGWHFIEKIADKFFKYAIDVSKNLSEECFQLLVKDICEHWSNRHWKPDLKLEVAKLLFKSGDTASNYVNALKEIENQIAEYDDASLKIDGYSKLIGGYALVGETQKSQQLMSCIIEGSFEIFHRKDRQFTDWVDWLIKFAKSQPDMAFEPIKKFSGALVLLEKSGRGRGVEEAASKLIKLVTSLNTCAGGNLAKWLLERGGVHYEIALSGFMEGMLERSNAPITEITQTASKLLIPFEEYNPSKLPLKLVQSIIANVMDPDVAKRLIEALVHAVRTYALPSNRRDWLSQMKEGEGEGLCGLTDIVDYEQPDSERRSGDKEAVITLKSGVLLNEKEVIARVSCVADLFELVKQVESFKYFHWDPLVTPYLEQLDSQQIQDLVTAFKPADMLLALVVAFSTRLIKLGEIAFATKLLDQRLKSESEARWDRDWSGPAKLQVFSAYKQIDCRKWSELALRDLVEEFIGDYRYPANLIWNLEEITDIIFDSNDLAGIWGEITEYVYQLTDFKDLENQDLPEHLRFDSTQEGLESLIDLVLYLFEIPAIEPQQMAAKLIQSFISNGNCNSALFARIAPRLRSPDQMTPYYLAVLLESAKSVKSFALEFKDEVQVLCVHKDIDIRLTAQTLADALNFAYQDVTETFEQLPISYKLELPRLQNTERTLPLSATRGAASDLTDSYERLRPFERTAYLLAEATGIPLQNIVTRAQEIMNGLAIDNKWDHEAERQLGEWMSEIGLKITYRRPRVTAARTALSTMIAELVDAGCISQKGAKMLCTMIKRSDLFRLSLSPSIRPSFIHKPDFKDREFSFNHQEWINDVTDADCMMGDTTENGHAILGETTSWRWLDWHLPTEKRFSMVCHAGLPKVTQDTARASSFFTYQNVFHAEEYPSTKWIQEPSIVILGGPWGLDLGRGNWLALNPLVANVLEWKLSSEGLFRWLDTNNDLMVESIYWMDGPMSRQPPNRDDICGEGWLVIATDKAVEQIKSAGLTGVKVNVTVRSYCEEDSGSGPESSGFCEVRSKW